MAAPQARTVPETKSMMIEVNTVDSTAPIMPHRVYGQDDLNRLYPALEVADAVGDEEVVQDSILEHGLQIAEGIMEKAIDHWRRLFQK